ncbi:hypothetical protein COOONC_24141 [Cooperia oncophora]
MKPMRSLRLEKIGLSADETNHLAATCCKEVLLENEKKEIVNAIEHEIVAPVFTKLDRPAKTISHKSFSNM